MAAGTLASRSDGELVERFLANHDEASFQALLQRHGPMVFRVCRRVLKVEQDVEDAFQATFLVLARQAGSIRKHQSLASWLHGVAYRVALDAQKANARRRKHEGQAATGSRQPLTEEVGWKELRSIFDEELVKLPGRLRAPLVLCYLEGLTQDEAAGRLGQSKSTLRRTLERGRELLCARLTRRGLTLSAALFAPLLSEGVASAAVPAALTASTTEAAAALAAGKAVPAPASARALLLAQGLVQPVLSAKVKWVCVLALAAVLAGMGGTAVPGENCPVLPPPPPGERQEVAKAAAIAPPPATKVDEQPVTKRIEFRVPLLVLHAEVQTELKLTAEQVRTVGELARAVDARVLAEARAVDARVLTEAVPVKLLPLSGPAETANKLLAEKHKVLRKALPDILTNTQALRLRQLERQAAGMTSFQDPENVKLLALTEEQRGKVKAIIAQARAFRPVVQYGRVVAFDYRKTDREAVQQILGVLSEDQRQIWRKLTGETVEILPLHAADLLLAPTRFPSAPRVGRSLPPPTIASDSGNHR
jgi:RNA polymerase sigma factor (sigma-70 family)